MDVIPLSDIGSAILGVAGLLALTTLLVPLAARANVAFSLVLAGAGIILALVSQTAQSLGLGGPGGDFLLALLRLNLSSDTFIQVFLPVLLFETAVAIDVRRLMDDIAPILLLAVVAVLVSTFVVGLALATVAKVGVVACLLLAAIISTTDPIAVVAIFRELGVPHRLGLLVEGESLFNDAAAISLFALFLGMLTGDRATDIGDGTLDFLRGFAGGLGVGVLCGLAVCWGVILLRGQRFAEITLTVAAAYLVFLIGEHYLHVSGVVAVVAAALTIGYYGRTQVSAETWSALIDVWQQLGYWASALIFLLATMQVPTMLSSMNIDDLGLLAVLIVSALGARALVLFGMFPLLTALGWAEPVGRPLRTVILWGGLRGAISLALALAVVENPRVPEEVKDFVSVLCTAFVLFTLFVNAPLLRPLIRLFGLDRLSPAERTMRGRAITSALDVAHQRVREAAAGYGIAPPMLERIAASYSDRRLEAEAEIAAHGDDDLNAAVRCDLATLADREHALYLHHYREGILSGGITRALLANAARLQDAVRSGGAEGYAVAAQAALAFPVSFRLALALQRRLGLERPLAAAIANRIEALLMTQAALRDLIATIPTRPEQDHSLRDAQAIIAATLATRQTAVETALTALRLQYAEFSAAMELHYLKRAAVRIEQAQYQRLRAEAAISHEVHRDLTTDLARRARRLAVRPPLDLKLDATALVGRVPAFAGLNDEQRAAIIRLLRPRLTVPGETILRKGDRGDAMYFIASGAVEVRLNPAAVRLGSGEFFGEMALVTSGRRTADVVALGYCSLLVLGERDFRALLDAGPDLRRRIDETARLRATGGESIAPQR